MSISKWFQRWKDRRQVELLVRQFEEFNTRNPQFANKCSREQAFKWFCQLESWGPDLVALKLARGDFDFPARDEA